MILSLIGFLFTISGDMTPDEQATAIRRVITRGACVKCIGSITTI